jgi:hypothetical protein
LPMSGFNLSTPLQRADDRSNILLCDRRNGSVKPRIQRMGRAILALPVSR